MIFCYDTYRIELILMKSDDYHLRDANIQDLPTLLKCEKGIVDAERPYHDGLADDPIHYYDLTEFIKSRNAVVRVLEYDHKIVATGYVNIIEAKSYETLENLGYIGFIYVSPEHRGKGLSNIIIDSLCNWCKNRNIKEVRLEVYLQNKRAIRAYEKSDFSPHLLSMRRIIS